ncbi:hypothetical protein EBX93_04135 [bacterium]|nr:hypothetical protein [bacterium]
MDTTGVVVLKVLDGDFTALFRETEQGFPEFKAGARPMVLGGFAAYGNPASFHAPFVKMIRQHVATKVLASGIFKGPHGVEILFDRIMHRHPNQKPGVESPHRDVTPAKFLKEADDDRLFGGWVNLGRHDQFFIGKPGSHLGVRNTFEVARSHQGFCVLPKDSPEYAEYQKTKQTFRVPPGHIIIFPQHLLHEVVAHKTPEQFRLFIGWRLTLSNTVLFPNKEQSIDELGVPTMPSGQVPPMFSPNHCSAFKNKPFSWCGETESGTLSEWWDRSLKVPYGRHLGSLKQYGFEYPGYTEEEKKFMMTVHRV